MPVPVKTYDLASVFLLVKGNRIGGFGETAVCELSRSSPKVSMKIGADGQTVGSRSNDKSMVAKITVMESSKSYRILAELSAAQDLEEVFGRCEFLLNDDINGDKINEQYAVFIEDPAPSKAKEVGERVFVIFLPAGAEKQVLGGSITI